MEVKNKLLIGLILIASMSLFIVTIRTPEFAEGVGNAWDVMFNATKGIE